jgi:hypothetical protein
MKRVRFLYARNENKFPVGCIAYIRDKDSEDNDQIIYNYSIYNPNEKFDKKTARIWAAGLLATSPRIYTADGNGYHVNELLFDVCSEIVQSVRPDIPPAVKQRLDAAIMVNNGTFGGNSEG